MTVETPTIPPNLFEMKNSDTRKPVLEDSQIEVR